MKNEINEMINAWFDGELDKKNEAVLFNLLATDAEAREMFRSINELKSAIASTGEDFPDDLDERILRSVSPKAKEAPSTPKWHLLPSLGYAFSIVLAVIALVLFMELRTYRSGLDDLTSKVKEQDQTIKMMFNAYPTIVVKPTHNRVNQ